MPSTASASFVSRSTSTCTFQSLWPPSSASTLREVCMHRIRRVLPKRQPGRTLASGYHDPVTTRFIEADTERLRRRLDIAPTASSDTPDGGAQRRMSEREQLRAGFCGWVLRLLSAGSSSPCAVCWRRFLIAYMLDRGRPHRAEPAAPRPLDWPRCRHCGASPGESSRSRPFHWSSFRWS